MIERDDWEGALKQFEKACSLADDPEFEPTFGLAICKYATGDVDGAMAVHDEAIALDAESRRPEALRELLWGPTAIEAAEELNAACDARSE
jgi:hypothetical protein